MKIFLTGATGFLGHHIIKLLLEKKIYIKAMVRSTSKRELLPVSPFIEIQNASLSDIDSLVNAMQGCDAVIHAASFVSFDPEDESLMFEVNVKGTENMCKAWIKTNRNGRFIYVSSVNALGFPQEGKIGNEDTAFNWQSYNIAYMNTKRLAENIVLEYVSKENLDGVIVNPGTLFGEGDIYGHSSAYIKAIGEGKVWGWIKGGFTQSCVDKVADGILKVIEKGKKGERYILGGFNLSYKEFFDLASSALKKNRPFIKIPFFLFATVSYLYWFFCKITGLKATITPGLIKAAPKYLFYSSEKAIKYIGYDPGTLEDLKKNIILQYQDIILRKIKTQKLNQPLFQG